jgi:hypothetical protein
MDDMATRTRKEEPKHVYRSLANPYISEEEKNVLTWRQDQFRKLGVNPKVSDVLAESNVDIWRMKKLLEKGCDAQVALDILIGTNAMGWEDHVYTPEWFDKRLKEVN